MKRLRPRNPRRNGALRQFGQTKAKQRERERREGSRFILYRRSTRCQHRDPAIYRYCGNVRSNRRAIAMLRGNGYQSSPSPVAELSSRHQSRLYAAAAPNNPASPPSSGPPLSLYLSIYLSLSPCDSDNRAKEIAAERAVAFIKFVHENPLTYDNQFNRHSRAATPRARVPRHKSP